MELLTHPLFLGALSLIILIYSAILHEIAHGYVADRFGDPTARLMGRLTLNPKPHIDPLMSIALPLLLIISNSPIIFGGAKPVPVDPFNLREGRKDIALVSLAGPLTNGALAVIAAFLLHLFFPGGSQSLTTPLLGFINFILFTIVRLNVLLAIFNLLPLPPLDGSKIFSLVLPPRAADAYLAFGNGPFGSMFLLMLLLFVPGMQQVIGTIYYFALSLLGF
jgi:Zn-dependent protease